MSLVSSSLADARDHFLANGWVLQGNFLHPKELEEVRQVSVACYPLKRDSRPAEVCICI